VTVLVERDGSTCRLRVDDDGTGFSPGTTPGSGAGLANLRDRIDAVGGTVSVASSPGHGTTVTARVPAVPLPRPAA
jgi:signal transduction histidine kinase